MTSYNSFDLIYCDTFLLVANKPAGLLAVPGRGEDKQDCLSARVQKVFPDALVVHRLDMATSGLMVFARDIEMQRRFSKMFCEHKVEKQYVSLVSGRLDTDGEINLPIAADWPNRPLRKIDHDSGKDSLTRYRLLAYDSVFDTSRVELKPITGRTHQLRLHLAAIGHPILGDGLYGFHPAERLMLLASRLAFAHPDSGEPLHFANSSPF